MTITSDDLKDFRRLAEHIRAMLDQEADWYALSQEICGLKAAIRYGPESQHQNEAGEWGQRRHNVIFGRGGRAERPVADVDFPGADKTLRQALAEIVGADVMDATQRPKERREFRELLLRFLDATGGTTPADGPQTDGTFWIEGLVIGDLTPTERQLLEYLWDNGEYTPRSIRQTILALNWNCTHATARTHHKNLLRKLRTLAPRRFDGSAAKGILIIRRRGKTETR